MKEVKKIVFEAGKILKKRYIDSFSVYEKEKGHLATDVDTEVEIYLKEKLYDLDSSIRFYGEDSKGSDNSDRRWIVDSLDGTANYIFGVSYFCTSIALECKGKITYSAVYNPISEEYFEASEYREGAFCNGQKISVSHKKLLHESKIVFGFSANYGNIERYHSEWTNIFDGCLKGLGLLSPAMNLCNVARGRTEAFIDFGCSMEGQAAGGYILEKAGGNVLNYDQSSWDHSIKGIIGMNDSMELKEM